MKIVTQPRYANQKIKFTSPNLVIFGTDVRLEGPKCKVLEKMDKRVILYASTSFYSNWYLLMMIDRGK